MRTWEFAKALHLQKANGCARFVSMQDCHNLLEREEEREMLPLCGNEGVQTIVYSPFARGRLARPWGEGTARSEAEAAHAGLHAATAASDEAIVRAVGEIVADRGVSRAQIAHAWLRRHPDVAAPIVGRAPHRPHRRRGRRALAHPDGRRGREAGGALHPAPGPPGRLRPGRADPQRRGGDRVQLRRLTDRSDVGPTPAGSGTPPAARRRRRAGPAARFGSAPARPGTAYGTGTPAAARSGSARPR